MAAQANLFQTNSIPLGELVEMVEQRLLSKCQKCHVSFGIFKSGHKNLVDHNALVIITNKAGHHYNISVHAESMRDLFEQVNDKLQELAK